MTTQLTVIDSVVAKIARSATALNAQRKKGC